MRLAFEVNCANRTPALNTDDPSVHEHAEANILAGLEIHNELRSAILRLVCRQSALKCTACIEANGITISP